MVVRAIVKDGAEVLGLKKGSTKTANAYNPAPAKDKNNCQAPA
jgi:hypothetical protein